MLSDYSHFRPPSHLKCTSLLPSFHFSSILPPPCPESRGQAGGRLSSSLIPHPSLGCGRTGRAGGREVVVLPREWEAKMLPREWEVVFPREWEVVVLPREWEAELGPCPPQRLPRAQVSAPRPNPHCRVPGNCSGRQGHWKTKWGAHPSFKCRSQCSGCIWKQACKGRAGNTLLIFCLFFTFTPGPPAQKEHIQMCDVLFFLNKSSASCIKSPRKITTKQTQHLDHGTISPGELPSSPLSQHSQLTGLLPEQPGTQGNICRTEQECWALYCAIDLVFYKHIHLHCTGEEKAKPGHKNKTHTAENL